MSVYICMVFTLWISIDFLVGLEYGRSLEPIAASSTQFLSVLDKFLQRNVIKKWPTHLFENQNNRLSLKNGIISNLGNVERFWMKDGESRHEKSGRTKRSYVNRYAPVGVYDLPKPIPIDYILVVVIIFIWFWTLRSLIKCNGGVFRNTCTICIQMYM